MGPSPTCSTARPSRSRSTRRPTLSASWWSRAREEVNVLMDRLRNGRRAAALAWVMSFAGYGLARPSLAPGRSLHRPRRRPRRGTTTPWMRDSPGRKSSRTRGLATVPALPDAAPTSTNADAADAALETLKARQADLERQAGAPRVATGGARGGGREAEASGRAHLPGVALSLLGMPVRIFGNITLRYDYSTNSNLTESLTNGIQANWLLTRIRFGAEFGDKGPVTGGIRMSSGESPSPTVPFVVLSDAFRPASFGVDQAWAAVRPFADRDRLQLSSSAASRTRSGAAPSAACAHADAVGRRRRPRRGPRSAGEIYKSGSELLPVHDRRHGLVHASQRLARQRVRGAHGGRQRGRRPAALPEQVPRRASATYFEWWKPPTRGSASPPRSRRRATSARRRPRPRSFSAPASSRPTPW